MADLVRRRVAVIATPAAPLLRSRPKRRPRRSRSSSASAKTRSGSVWSRASPGRVATRQASIFSSVKWWQSGWGCCTSWCPRRLVLPCWSIRPMLRPLRPRYETYRRCSCPRAANPGPQRQHQPRDRGGLRHLRARPGRRTLRRPRRVLHQPQRPIRDTGDALWDSCRSIARANLPKPAG